MNNDRFKFRVFNKIDNSYDEEHFFLIRDDGKLHLQNGDGDIFEVSQDRFIIEQCTGLSAAKSYRGARPEDLLIFAGDRYTGNIQENHGFGRVIYGSIEWQGGAFLLHEFFSLKNFGIDKIKNIEIIGTIHEEGK